MILENERSDKPNATERRSRFIPSYTGLGKLPPQAVDLEEAVLGAIMLEKTAIESVADFLKAENFYKDAHQKIYQAIQILQLKSEPIDILTITAALRSAGDLEIVGGAYYITELTNRVASAANIEFHARIVLQKYIQRELIRINADVVAKCYDDTTDVFEVITESELEKDKLITLLTSQKEVSNSDLLHTRLKQHELAGLSQDHITGVPSGFTEIDKITGGWQKSDLIIIAARPAMGKTSFALQCGCNAAIDFNKPVAVFSLEMSSIQLMDKEISIETDVPLWKFKKKGLDAEDWSRIHHFTPKLEDAPIMWDDTPALNIMEFRAKCRRLKSKHDIQLIIIDYLQLLNADAQNKGGNREQTIGFISRQLKATAKELNVPVIALSQLSRKVEERPGGAKRPMLSDLRESGSIEQDADLVLFMYRDEYYGITEDANGRSTAGLAEVTIAKHRNGDTGDAILRFNKETTGFKDDEVAFTPAEQLMPSDNSANNDFKGFIIRPNESFDNDDGSVPF